MTDNFDFIPHKIASICKELGFLNEIRYRNYCIREKFYYMRLEGKKIEQIELELSEVYFISPEAIHQIIYSKRKYL